MSKFVVGDVVTTSSNVDANWPATIHQVECNKEGVFSYRLMMANGVIHFQSWFDDELKLSKK